MSCSIRARMVDCFGVVLVVLTLGCPSSAPMFEERWDARTEASHRPIHRDDAGGPSFLDAAAPVDLRDPPADIHAGADSIDAGLVADCRLMDNQLGDGRSDSASPAQDMTLPDKQQVDDVSAGQGDVMPADVLMTDSVGWECTIGGVAHYAGERKLGSDCMVCDPLVSVSRWTLTAAAAALLGLPCAGAAGWICPLPGAGVGYCPVCTYDPALPVGAFPMQRQCRILCAGDLDCPEGSTCALVTGGFPQKTCTL